MFLELKNTNIGYKTPLIKGVNAELNLGEVGLLIGNNGVGKTTLIKTILNQIPSLDGEILLRNKSVSEINSQEIAEQIAVVFSKANVPAHFSLVDLVSFGKYIHYPYYFQLNKSDKHHVEEIIQSLNLTQYRDFPLKKLSDGNLQKAFIGRALAQNTPMIILDEPTTHLDEENKLIILKLLRELAEKHNKLILFSSHDWRLAKEFSDKIWYIKNQNLQSGIAEDILLNNQELSKPEIFTLNKSFISPQIFAPDLEKELLYSLLQKNFKRDLSQYDFRYKNKVWEISYDDHQEKVISFEEILKFLRNFH